MSNKTQLAPTLEDLSYAQIESSRLFGFTNISGKMLSVFSLSSLVGGAAGVAQGLGYMAPVAGISLTFPAGLGVLAASVVTGLVGYWLGNFDDKKIRAHNSMGRSFNAARDTMYKKVENGLIEALSDVKYDPAQNTLPYDVLGYAVLLTDRQIEDLPAHIQLDVYRTQLDLVLYKAKGLTSGNTVEGKEFEAETMTADKPMETRALEYKRCRSFIRQAIEKGTLTITPLTENEKKNTASPSSGGAYQSNDGNSEFSDAVSDVLDDLARVRWRTGRASKPWSGGGGEFGGGGAGGSWSREVSKSLPGSAPPAQVPVFFPTGSLDTSIGGSSAASAGAGLPDFDPGSSAFDTGSGGGSSGFDLSDVEVDKDSAGPLLVLAGIAAVLAAAAVSGFSLWKNFISRAEAPKLGNVPLPLITKSLASAEKDVRRMYTPS